jgi:hypothetical protein
MSGTFRLGFGFLWAYGKESEPPDVGDRLSYHCPYCLIDTHGQIASAFVVPQSEYVRLPASEMQLHALVLQCTRCNGVALLLWPYGKAGEKHMTTDRMMVPFPQTARQVFGPDDRHVPAAILEDLRQAELSMHAGAVYGAGLLLRRACQYICRDKGCTGRNLEKEIDALAPQHITPDMAGLAHGIRVVGNELAHPDAKSPAKVSTKDVRDCWEFVVELIRVIYVHPARRQALRERLAASLPDDGREA